MSTTFEHACALLSAILAGPARREIVADVASAATFRHAMMRLRERMRSHVWPAGGARVNLEAIVRKYDSRTRAEGFHVLHDWDGKADRVNAETIAVDVLDYVAHQRESDPPDAAAIAILIDYHFMHLLSLLTLRVWDEGDADENLERVNQLLRDLQGPDGSGHRFAADAETLLLVATSHFELQEVGYDRLLANVRRLDRAHRVNIALGHASSMGCHLRFGFEATYARDTLVMRRDNVADYPWLCFALFTLMEEYARLRTLHADAATLAPIVEALLNGLSADARAFVGEPAAALAPCEPERTEFRRLFLAHRDELLAAFEPYRPSEPHYSPLAFFFNFSHNILKGTVVDALLRGEAWPVTLNDLLAASRGDAAASETRTRLATTLMGYARANPDRIRGQLMPVIVYDPHTGRQAFTITIGKLRE